MKALFVGDHRDTVNWGGRGQSIALYQLLSENYDICGVVTGNSVLSVEANDGYVKTLLPQKFIRFFYRVRNKSKLVDWYLRIEEFLGARDFITDDPKKSVEYLLRYKDKCPGLSEIYQQVKDADLVVINGEGSGIFRTPFRRDFFFYLAMIELGALLGKKIFYVNGIISDCPTTGRNIKNCVTASHTLAKCSAVLVRDPESFDLVTREMAQVNCQYFPDALFTWFPVYEKYGSSLPVNGDFIISPPENNEYLGKLDFSKPYICVGGSSLAALNEEKALYHYSLLLEKIKELGYPVYLTVSCGGDRFLEKIAKASGVGLVPVNTPVLMAGAVLANARLFISGRFHATILASLGGTPCIFLEAHSHKMSSLRRTLEYDQTEMFSAFPIAGDIKEILSLAKTYLSQGNSLRNKIRSVVAKRCEEAKQLTAFIQENL